MNAPGKPTRLIMYRSKDAEVPGEVVMSDWRPTWCGQKQLTHLLGARECLRKQKRQSVQQTLDTDLLAEHGRDGIELFQSLDEG